MMTALPPRRSGPKRISPDRPQRRSSATIGACTVCGVVFAAPEARRAQAAEVLRVHELICPGGDRAGQVAEPFA